MISLDLILTPPQTSLHHIEREVSFSFLFLTLGLYRSFFFNKISGPTVLIYITCEKNYQKKILIGVLSFQLCALCRKIILHAFKGLYLELISEY